MPIHEYTCRVCTARFERLYRKPADVPPAGDLSCPRCGGQVRRLVGGISLGGRVDVGVGRAGWPHSWADTQAGDAELIRHWRRQMERETSEEQRNPELVPLRHENAVQRYEQQHGTGSAQPAGSSKAVPTHSHAWTAVPFVAPTRNKQ